MFFGSFCHRTKGPKETWQEFAGVFKDVESSLGDTGELVLKDLAPRWCVGGRLHRAKAQDAVGQGFEVLLGAD